jgi:hypothetical protein
VVFLRRPRQAGSLEPSVAGVRELVNAALVPLDGKFAELYEAGGRPSITGAAFTGTPAAVSVFDPLVAATGRAVGIRSVVSLVVGLGIDDAVFDGSTFSKNRDRLLTSETAQGYLCAPTPRRPKRTHGSIARAMARRAGSPTSAMP